MRNKTRVKLAAFGLLIAATTSATFTVNTLTASGENDSPLLVTELFEPSEMRLETMSQDKNLESFDMGLSLTSSNVQNTLEWKQDCLGDFSFVYLPNKAGSTYEAQSLEITFTDVESGNNFAIVVEHAATMNAYVRVEDVNAGLFYIDNNLLEYTSFSNEDGAYTRFSAKKIGVRFDPSTMCVYVGNAEGALSLVWDLSKAVNDEKNIGVSLNPFADYRVSFRMPSFFSNSGSLVLYEVNGYRLDGFLVEQTGKPSIFADIPMNALVGEEYTLPQAIGSDLLDGTLDVQTELYDASGKVVKLTNNTFTPTQAGDYTVKYKAKNSFGRETVKELILTAYEANAVPAYTAELDWTLNDEYVLNEQVYIPELWISGGLRRYGRELGKLTIEKDGETYSGFENKTSGFSFTFTQAGSYEFVYDINGEEVRYNVLVDNAENVFVAPGLQSQYAKNSVVDFVNSYVSIGGEKTDFDFTVKYPSGKRYKNKKFQATEVGRYALNAVATVNGKTYSFEKFFIVAEDNTDYFIPLHGVEVKNGISSFTRKEGVVVTSTHSGALVEYALPINISKYVNQRDVTEENGEITRIKIAQSATPLIELTVDPDRYGVRAATEAYVYLTDAADPNNKITINASAVNQYARITAGATGQSLKGFNPSSKGALTIDGGKGDIGAYGSGGCRVWHPFAGSTNGAKKPKESLIALYYDNEAKQLLARFYADPQGDYYSQVVVDFDDIRYLGSDLPWSGFKSDYVYLSFSMNKLSGSQASACVYSVDGHSFGAVEENAPTIQVNSEDALVGLKGYSLAVPNATATDCYSNPAKIVSKVYYEKDGNRFDVSVQNGRFNTPQSGDYYIVYTATDVFGRTSEKQIKVEVAETHEALKATLEDPTAEYVSGKIRDEIPVWGIENVALTGAIGEAESVCKVYLGAEEIAYKGGIFIPEKAGEYKVEYTFTDAVGRTESVSYNVEIAVPEAPVITSALPAYVGFVRGNSYEIADVYFIDYTKSEIAEQKADVYIDGEKWTGAQYAVEDKTEGKDATEEVESLLLEYKSGDFVLKSYEIPVKTVLKEAERKLGAQTLKYKKYLMERYFLADSNAVTLSSQQMYVGLTSLSSDASISFIQPLEANNFSLVLDIDQAKNADLSPIENNLKSIKIRLTDTKNIEKTLLVELRTNEASKKVCLCVNNEEYSAGFTGSLVGTAVEQINLCYTDGYFKDGNKGAKLLTPSHYENGETFEGFSDSVYVSLTIEMIDETKGETIRLYSFNGQTLTNNLEWDSTGPVISVEKEISGLYEQGSKLEISQAKAYDVISNVLSDSLSVCVTYEKNGETKYAKDVNGLTINGVSAKKVYVLALDQSGAYTIVYTAKDCRGNEGERRFTFEVVKVQNPTISLKGELPESVKAGTVVNVPDAIATYAEENEKNLMWIVVISPSTNTYTLVDKDDPAFKATQLGDYVIRYCAIDVYGAYTVVEYTITCYA